MAHHPKYSRREALKLASLGAGALSLRLGAEESAKTLVAPAGGVVDFAVEQGTFRPLHGVNNGPFNWGGRANVSVFHREAGIPWVRLHDVHWPSPDVVDIPCIFPLFHADHQEPANYRFARTDAYIKTIVNLGERITWRLGVSIEHSGFFETHPPPDFAKWAAICVNVIRHYNQGWAGGFQHNIRYWEIWNEPSNGRDMWAGTREQYFQLYETAARAIKAHDPSLKVGGPAIGNHRDPWVPAFLEYCRERKLPLDFFSWHCYTGSPRVLTEAAGQVRATLDGAGFTATESHLNEWHYLGDGWDTIRAGDPHKYAALRAGYARLNGPEGAAFAAASLMLFQDCRLDVANYYTGDTNRWGLFDEYGVPKKTYYAFRAFNELCKTPRRVSCTGTTPDARLVLGAGIANDGSSANVMVASLRGTRVQWPLELRNLPWRGATRVEVYRVEASDELAQVATQSLKRAQARLELALPASGLCLVRLSHT